MSRIPPLTVALASVVVAAVASCKGAEEPAPAAPVEVVLWHSYRDGEAAALEQLARKYNSDHADAQVSLRYVPHDGFADEVATAVPRGDGPDLFVFAHDRIGEWVDRGHLLEPIGQRFGPDLPRRFLPQTVKALVYRASLYGLPLAFRALALFYDPAVVTTPPDTLDRFVAAAKAATDPASGRYGLVYEAGLLFSNAPFFHGFGATLLDERGVPHLDAKPAVDALAFVKGLVQAGVVPGGVDLAKATAMFNEGKAAMVLAGPGFRGGIGKGRRYAVTMLPMMAAGRARPFLETEAVFLSAYSKHKETALRVMDWLTSDASAAVRLEVGRQTVANLAVYDAPEVRADGVISAFRAQAENAVLMPSCPGSEALWTAADAAIGKAAFGDAEPAAALAEAQAKAAAGLAKAAR